MRYVCVLLVLLGMPLPASAQQQHRSDRPPAGPGATSWSLPAIGLPTPIPYQKPWEWRVPAPAWERPQVPAWERQGPPPWERGHVARPVYPDQHQRRRTPPVVYVMQPYPVAQPYPVYVTVPAPPAPPAAPVEPEVEPAPPPPPPIVLPTGSRTLYVIRGCYLGNVKPDADRLPEGCDIRRMKIYEP